jgi:hypothetical protein
MEIHIDLDERHHLRERRRRDDRGNAEHADDGDQWENPMDATRP